MIKNLRNKYQNVKLSTKLLTLVLTIIVVAAFCVRFNYNVIIGVTGVIVLSVLTETLLKFPKTISFALTCVLQVVFIALMSFYLGLSFGSTSFSIIGVQSIISISFVVVSLILTIQAIIFSKNKLWLTTALSFGILDFSGFLITSVFPEFPLIMSIIIAGVVSSLFVVLRSLKPRKKITAAQKIINEKVNELTSDASFTFMKKFLEEQKATFTTLEEEKTFLLNTGETILIIRPISFSTKPTIQSLNNYLYQSVPVNNIFLTLFNETTKMTRSKKINENKSAIIFVDTSNKYVHDSKGYSVLQLATKNDKFDSKRRMIISNKTGLLNYVSLLRKDQKPNNYYSKVIEKL